MFKLSKATDYGIALMAQLASDPSGVPHNARELAQASDLPVPMVGKILKALAKEGILDSQRGSKGGYRLSRPPEELTVAAMIQVLEGPVALTDCAIGPFQCEHESLCTVRKPWQLISRVVERALSEITLADLVNDQSTHVLSEMLQISREPEANNESPIN
ncbi:MAG: SUF system Fe-S cluster assembly regulator [Myxococcota bacterium]